MVSKSQIIIYSIVFLLSSCNFLNSSDKQSNKQNEFYNYYQDGDLSRIPLIEPYFIYSADNGENWVFDVPFGGFLQGLQISSIRSIAVNDSLFFLYSDLISLPGETSPAWFVFDIDNKTSKYFTDYSLFISEYPKAKKMQSVKKLFSDFKSKNYLPWK